MNRTFILRIEQQGRVSFQVVRGHREVMGLAQAYVACNRNHLIAVLDATGRIVWQTKYQTAA